MAIKPGWSSQPEAMIGFDGGGSENSSLRAKRFLVEGLHDEKSKRNIFFFFFER